MKAFLFARVSTEEQKDAGKLLSLTMTENWKRSLMNSSQSTLIGPVLQKRTISTI